MKVKITLINSAKDKQGIKELKECKTSIESGEFFGIRKDSWLKDISCTYEEIGNERQFKTRITIIVETDTPEGIEKLMEIKNSILSGEMQRENDWKIKTKATFEYIER